MRNVPMVEFPKAAEPVLSKALETHKAHRGTYTAYKTKNRVQCDECVWVLHEAGGKGWSINGAKQARNSPSGRLLLCTPHAELWRAIDGIGKGR